MFKKIIVGVDFSETSERVGKLAASLAAGLGAELVTVHVMPSPQTLQDPAGNLGDIRGVLEEKLKKFAAELQSKAPEAKVDWGLVDGNPAEELSTFASRWNGDVIVVATAGRSGLPRALLGSVADRLIRTAKVPVLVVGPEAD